MILKDVQNDVRVIGKDMLADKIIGVSWTCSTLEETRQEAPESIDECVDLLKCKVVKAFVKTSPLSLIYFVLQAV